VTRSLVLGNGSVFVGFDATYSVRDLFYPNVGAYNHTMGNVCHAGLWVDGDFAWLDGPGWERELAYEPDTLVTRVVLRRPETGWEVRCSDYVDMGRNFLVRNLTLATERGFQTARAFFHYDWFIDESDIGNTVFYEPRYRAVIAYKGERYFLLGGRSCEEPGVSSWATGKKGGPATGTWLDAEDGSLGRNPIEQGAVDCTVQLDLPPAGAGAPSSLTHWVCCGARYEEVTRFGQDLIVGRGEDLYRGRTRNYWSVWVDKDDRPIEDEVGMAAAQLYRRSVLTARVHCDNRGGVIAAADFDSTGFARDTYAYVWPRDGALVANALDRSGHEDITRKFFEFCQRVLAPGGMFLHKYSPQGWPGSSWHPWVDERGQRVLPIQEDETGLVLWSLWEHFRLHRNLDFVMGLYSTLVVPAGRFLAGYVDERNGLPLPSWDLWEERLGVHAFTAGAVWGGLWAAERFGDLFGDTAFKREMKAARDGILAACDRHLHRPELGRFARRLVVAEDGSVSADEVVDSALHGLWRFGMYAPDDDRVVATMEAVRDRLANRAAAEGLARYTNDYYFQVEHDVGSTPGNPWFICTLWLAQWYVAVARTSTDLKRARAIIDWTVRHQLPGGLLSEQLHPHTGAPLSVSPLTWSHAELVVTVDDYVRRASSLRRAR
jgi:GH15 family glucan-1,4-alpha-glucosidase